MSLVTILLLAFVAWMLFSMLRPGGHGGGCCGGGHGGHQSSKDGSDDPR
jgi:hypothetical protein